MTVLHRARRLAHRIGVDVRRYPVGDPAYERVQLMKRLRIGTVIDIGANEGQFGASLRSFGYTGAIHSVEPLSRAFQALRVRTAGDPQWSCQHVAVGASARRASLNIAANSVSSSLKAMLPAHETAAPNSGYVGVETVDVRTLDQIAPGAPHASSDRLCVKIDVQGGERDVLDGGPSTLASASMLQVEVGLVDLYSDAMRLEEFLAWAHRYGWATARVDLGFSDRDSGLGLQCDVIVARPLDLDGLLGAR